MRAAVKRRSHDRLPSLVASYARTTGRRQEPQEVRRPRLAAAVDAGWQARRHLLQSAPSPAVAERERGRDRRRRLAVRGDSAKSFAGPYQLHGQVEAR